MVKEKAIKNQSKSKDNSDMFNKWIYFQKVLNDIDCNEKYKAVKTRLKTETKPDKKTAIILNHIKANNIQL